MEFTFALKDWLYIGSIVGSGAVAWYRLGQMEQMLKEIKAQFVTKDVFNLTVDNLRLEFTGQTHRSNE